MLPWVPPWLLLGPHRPPSESGSGSGASYLLHWEQLRQNLHLPTPFTLGTPTHSLHQTGPCAKAGEVRWDPPGASQPRPCFPLWPLSHLVTTF